MTEAYKYYERYYIDFTSAPNGDGEVFAYHVSLQQRLVIPSFAPVPTPIELDGGRSPFVVSLQNEANPLMPMRSASARISFVDDIDLGELLPADAFEWRVELTRTTDGAKIFVGYLTAEVYTQPASGGVNVVTVNAASPMVPIAATAMPIEDKGALTIGELIRMAIETSDDIQTVYIPAVYSLKNNASAADYADLLRWRFSTGNFLRFTDEAVSGKNVECDTYQVALEAVCKLFGWSMVDCGDGSLYFISPAYQGPYMRVARTQLDGGRFTPELVTPSAFDSLAIIPIDKADTVDYQQGAGSASVTPSVKNATLEMQSFMSKASGWRFSQKSSTITDAQSKKHEVVVGKILPLKISTAQFPRYRATITEDDDHSSFGASVSWAEVTDETKDDTRDVQAELRKIDSCLPSAIEGGTNEKKAWSFEETILLNDFVRHRLSYAAHWIVFTPTGLPIVRLTGFIALVKSGALNINFSVRATPQDGFSIPENYQIAGAGESFTSGYGGNITLDDGFTQIVYNTLAPWTNPDLTSARKKITASLRIGDLYWNGYAWDGGFATFDIPISSTAGEWHSIETNKTISMPYDGEAGYFAEIYSGIWGNVEFCIYPPASDIGSGYPLRYEVKDLQVAYVPTLDYVDVDDADSIYQREFRTSFTEKVGESLILHSRVNNSEQMSLIYDSQEEVIDTLHRTTSTTAEKPERFLLDEYERIFGRTQRRWRRGLWLRELRPLDIFTLPAVTDSALMLTGYTMDFEENTAEAYLLDVKTINLVKYVE